MAHLPVRADVMYDEVVSARKILSYWEERLSTLPGIDTPGSESDLVNLLRELTGDLMVVANKANGLAVVVSEQYGR